MADVLFYINGVPADSRVRFPSVTLNDVLGAQPNTGSLTFDTVAPSVGDAIAIGLGSLDPDDLLFGGEIQNLEFTYQADVRRLALREWPSDLIDHTFALNQRRPFVSVVNESATTAAQSLIATYAPGFTSAHVQAGLPALTINFDGSQTLIECLNAIAQQIHGRVKVDYSRDVHLFIPPEPDLVPPDAITFANPPLNTPPIRWTVDLSQVRTRVYGKGHGEQVPVELAVGEPIVPVGDVAFFSATGGRAIASLTSDGAQTMQLAYTGIQVGGAGTLVGPGVGPAAAPTLTGALGGSLPAGVLTYAYTHVTPSGESLPSPLATISTATIPDINPDAPTPHPSAGVVIPSAFAGQTFYFACTYCHTTNLETRLGSLSPTVTRNALGSMPLMVPPTSVLPTGFKGYFLFASRDSGVSWHRVYNGEPIAGESLFVFSPTPINGGFVYSLGNNLTDFDALPGPTSDRRLTRVTVAGIAIGAGATTARKIYRTAVGGSQLKLLPTGTTFTNNTATGTFVDDTPDASLGANAPTGDTSALTQPAGQVNAGSTSVLTAGAAAFAATGGWAQQGQQVLRYTGITGNTLTGVPASGAGSIQTTIPYGHQITVVPALTGVTGVTRAIATGASVHVFVQRDDVAAQTALGQLERHPDGSPTDGIREYLISDDRRGESSLIDLCDADLATFARPIIGVTYCCRDPKTRAGSTVAVAFADGVFNPDVFNPAVFHTGRTTFGYGGDFLIQSVTITFDAAPQLLPRYAVSATSSKFTFVDLLQRVLISR